MRFFKPSQHVMEEFHQDGCEGRKFLYHIQKGKLPVTVSMSRVQTSSSDAD